MNNLFPLDRGVLLDLKNALHQQKNCMVFYALENNRYHIASKIARPFLYVVSDLVSAQKATEILSQYCEKEVLLMPEREDVFIPRKVNNLNSVYQRIDALYRLQNDDVAGMVITIEGLMQLYPKKDLFFSNILHLKLNQSLDISSISTRLLSMGYSRKEIIEKPSDFSLRGDILDIFPLGQDLPLRIEFFGDDIENIKTISLETMLCVEELQNVTILPCSDILVPENSVDEICNKFRKAKIGASEKFNEMAQNQIMQFVSKPNNALNTFFLPFMRSYVSCIYEYLSKDTVVIFDDAKLIDDKLQLFKNSNTVRLQQLISCDKLLDDHIRSFWDKNVLYDIPFTILGFGRITSQGAIFTPQEVFSIKSQQTPQYYLSISELYDNIRNYEFSQFTVQIYAKDMSSALALQKHLTENNLSIPINDLNNGVSIIVANIDYGFTYLSEKLVAIGNKDYSRQNTLHKSSLQKRQSFTLPEKGDYVVHEKHGIGISEGMQKVVTSDGEKDFYVILYRDGDRLYLPANQLDTIEKYNGGDEPKLHKIGGAEFERIKQKVRESVKTMAIDLLSLYQSRANQKGYVYPADTVWQEEMEKDFEFVPTDDQLIAISEIKQDMESGKIMDRLLCGDVGYGKTEVALRAIFKTVLENKQAVILAPTTILAQQHYNLICARLNKFKFNIELLSRFIPPKQQLEALKRIASGKSHIVVATHRILSNDVKFNDLGLLVLDEEQRFGVEHKEKLKVFKNKVNILSLSATPIPRTLHMALSGIRDISTLETPPKDRLPVETYVTEYNDTLLKNAVEKEINRGGKVFILYNRVATIESFYKKIRDILDDSIDIIMAHGQMKEDLLEDRINDFYEGKGQVLLSTTIIENGIDLPDANTLFVIDADALGLSQLYQLRGRVGRSNVLGYAYFTIREGKVLSENAIKRLDALMDNTELGSGFKIAMRDLEIRGAGNVLGREQHGQMEKVGYEMYLKLVKEGIDELKGERSVHKKDIEVVIDGSYSLEQDYIKESRARVSFYRKVSSLLTLEEAQNYQKQLVETYGKCPKNVNNIIRIGLIKNLAQQLNVAKLTINKKGVGIVFYDASPLANEGLIKALSDYCRIAVLSPNNPPTIVFNAKNVLQPLKIKMVLDFLVRAILH